MLQLALSDSCFALKEITDSWDSDASSFCELLVQLSSRSSFFSQIYDNFVPHLQASVGEIYGGNLLITSE
ncbi:hypothetical protein Leryth_014037 [Lithospermum erythrorhizon]|nr:hypothetical protein Leryth_014037 [Lithospermum erythrorhizon]